MITEGYPAPYELLRLDLNVLKYLFGLNQQRFDSFRTDAYRMYAQYKSSLNKSKTMKRRLGFSFDSSLDIQVDGKNDCKIHVVAAISADAKEQYENVSYHLVVAKKNPSPEILRIFHFDYNPKANVSDHPYFHMQYGGDMSPKLSDIYTDNYNSWLSFPRIVYKPMSLALLMHFAFVNFKDDQIDKILNDSCWRNIVKENEEYLWKSYFENTMKYLANEERGLVNEYFCGQS